MRIRNFSRYTAIYVCAFAGLNGCTSPEASLMTAPMLPQSVAPTSPSLNANTSTNSGTMIANVRAVPLPSESQDAIFELRFSFVGYSDAHAEPRIATHENVEFVGTDLETIYGRMRNGSTDRIHLSVCAREYSSVGIYNGCYGVAEVDFYPSDNGVEKIFTGQRFTNGYYVGNVNREFHVTLTWTPVDLQPVTIIFDPATLTSPNPSPTPPQIFATANDANG